MSKTKTTATRPTRSLNSVNAYPRRVVAGKETVCRWVRLACERHLRDLEASSGPGFRWTFDKKKALDKIEFMELMPHTKGRWAAKRELLTLSPFQLWIIGSIFGWVDKETGNRRFREAYLEIPRKNGKSIIGAGIGLACFVADREYGAEVYSGATGLKQAMEVFTPAKMMANKTPKMRAHFGVEVANMSIYREQDGSKFQPLIGNPGDGSSPSCAIVDEFHEHDNANLYDTMITGMGARDQPLMLIITTAGINIAGPCYEKRLEVQNMLEGNVPSDRLFGVIYTIDKDDDWKDPKIWKKANPNLGTSVNLDYLEAQVASALRSPSKQSVILCKHFNVWTGAKNAWLDRDKWASCGDSTLTREKCQRFDYRMSLDLATRIDCVAWIDFYSRFIDKDMHYYVFPRFFIPESALENSKNGEKYKGWVKQGFMETLGEDEIELAKIEAMIDDEGKSGLKFKEFIFDPWQAAQIAQSVRKNNIETVEFRHTVGNMSPAMREFEASVNSGRMHHNNNPVLNWMAGNVVAKADAKDNIYPRKELDHNKIDGIIATLMSVGRAMIQPEGKKYQIMVFGGKQQPEARA